MNKNNMYKFILVKRCSPSLQSAGSARSSTITVQHTSEYSLRILHYSPGGNDSNVTYLTC